MTPLCASYPEGLLSHLKTPASGDAHRLAAGRAWATFSHVCSTSDNISNSENIIFLLVGDADQLPLVRPGLCAVTII